MQCYGGVPLRDYHFLIPHVDRLKQWSGKNRNPREERIAFFRCLLGPYRIKIFAYFVRFVVKNASLSRTQAA